MKITLFQSDSGDCLLLTGKDGKRILVDGGMSSAYTKHVAPALGVLQKKKQKLDVVYVSHIDSDHISGILRMLDDLVEWRVYDFHATGGGGGTVKTPKSVRPPEIGAIWNNAFHDQLPENAGPIADMLAARARILSTAKTKPALRAAALSQRLATSKTEAVKLSHRIGAKQLNIPLNKPAQKKLMYVRDTEQQPIKVGGMRVHIIGPFEADLTKLRAEWQDWLEDQEEALRKLRDKAEADAKRLGDSLDKLIQPLLAQADGFGKRSGVTTPNLASLMLLVEEAGKTVLLTGDGFYKDVLKGLEHIGKLSGNGGLHVDVLKVQHHGATANIHKDFVQRITADQYIFCGNGAHENPELKVVELIAKSRIGTAGERSSNPQAGNKFTFRFNSSSTVSTDDKAHMKKVESLVKSLVRQSGRKLTATFMKAHASVLDV